MATASRGGAHGGKVQPEYVGILVAVIAHAVLMAILSREMAPDPVELPPSMEVSFVEEADVVSSAPAALEEPAPAIGDEAPVDTAPSASEATVPEPVVRPPVPEPVRPPTQTTERARPDLTRSQVPVRPAPTPAPTRVAERTQPRPTPPQPQRRPQAAPQRPAQTAPQRPAPQRPAQQAPSRPAPNPGPAQRRGPSFADVASTIGRAPPTARGNAPAPRAATVSTQERASFTAALASKIARCTSAQRPSTQEARELRPVVVIRLREDGSLDGAPVIRAVEGLNENNRQYETQVREAMLRAVRNCAPYTGLPAEMYGVPNGWQQPPPIRMTFR